MTIPSTYAAGRPPVIGISGMNTDSKSVQAMGSQVIQAGGIPRVLANHAVRNPEADIEKLDGLMVMGNDFDVDPNRYIGGYPAGDPRGKIHPKTVSAANNPEAAAREAYEIRLLELAAERKLPTVPICAGMQLLNVMRGGGLLQHIPDQIGNDRHEQNVEHIPGFCPVTAVEIEKNSFLGRLAGKIQTFFTPSYPPHPNAVGVNENSFHHQAIDPDRVGYGLRITAFSDRYTNVHGQERRLPEAIEPNPNGPLAGWPMVAVQWHPEFGASRVSAALIGNAVAQAAQYAEHSPRDRSHDMANAMAANIVSAKKPAQGFVSFVDAQNRQPQRGIGVMA